MLCSHFHEFHSFFQNRQSKRARTQIRKKAIEEIEKKLREVFDRGVMESFFARLACYFFVANNNAYTGYFELRTK